MKLLNYISPLFVLATSIEAARNVVSISTEAVIPTVTATTTVQTPVYVTQTVTDFKTVEYTHASTATLIPTVSAYELNSNQAPKVISSSDSLLHRTVIDVVVPKTNSTVTKNGSDRKSAMLSLSLALIGLALIHN